MGQFIDLHGQRFGRWTVLSLGERIIPRGHRYWLCRCDCGTEREVKGGSLRNGSSASCRKCSHLGELYIPVDSNCELGEIPPWFLVAKAPAN